MAGWLQAAMKRLFGLELPISVAQVKQDTNFVELLEQQPWLNQVLSAVGVTCGNAPAAAPRNGSGRTRLGAAVTAGAAGAAAAAKKIFTCASLQQQPSSTMQQLSLCAPLCQYCLPCKLRFEKNT